VRNPEFSLAGKCCICSIKEKLEIHRVKTLRKDGVPIEDITMVVLIQRKKLVKIYPVPHQYFRSSYLHPSFLRLYACFLYLEYK
jgi:hypothetical protein